MNEKKIYGLIGEKLSHSVSPKIHNMFGYYDYELFELKETELESFIKKSNIGGLNVTIPYKETVIKYCDILTEKAAKIGAVNCIYKKDNLIVGDNTDYDGFLYLLESININVKNKSALILGTGGTSKTAAAVLKDRGINRIIKLSRNGSHNYNNIEEFNFFDILINTTPVGMYPHTNDELLVDLSKLKRLSTVIDVVYNPSLTFLLQNAKERNIKYIGGLNMLIRQAKIAAELFTGETISNEDEKRIQKTLKSELTNMVFIGMPGAGKTTVARITAKKLGKKHIDTDSEIVKKFNMTIPEIFKLYGEKKFREVEAEIIATYGKEHGLVISVGGGALLDEKNIKSLSLNGEFYLIKRSVDKLATKGRPLSKDKNALHELETKRMPIYRRYADYIINNNKSLDNAVSTVLKYSR